MTPPTYNGGYGLNATPAHIREYGDMSCSASLFVVTPTADTAITILTAPGAGKYFNIWGVSMNSNHSNSTLGTINDSGSSSELVLGFAVSKEGPTFMMFPFPVRLSENVGVEVNWTVIGSSSKHSINVFYTEHNTSLGM